MLSRRLNHSPACHIAALAAMSAFVLFTHWAQAGCLESDDPDFQAYNKRIYVEPAALEREVSARLATGADTGTQREAELYSVLASVYSTLDRYDESRAAAERGLALVPDPRNPIHVNLLATAANTSFDDNTLPRARERTQAALELQPPTSPAAGCLLFALGVLEQVAHRPDQASIHLTRAYRISDTPERYEQRIAVAEVLSVVLSDLNDLPQALSLNAEVIAWNEVHAPSAVSTTRFMRGAILRKTGDLRGAMEQYSASRQLAASEGDELGVAYADLHLCGTNIELAVLPTARSQCQQALTAFTAAQSTDPRKQTLTALARIDLLQDDPKAALVKLDEVLEQGGRGVAPFRLEAIHELRARVHKKLGHADAALADYEVYLERYKASRDATQAREAAALRARFETDREIERNAFLERELEGRNERLSAQSARLRWMIVSALAGALLIALLVYLLVDTRRKKRLMAQLAEQDDLTGLPNRRRTLQLATLAFERAREQGESLTIGVLDLDHFKQINDRFGHATGDLVLKSFAVAARQVIRDSDVLGRWGGEEFLIVLPDTSLDIGLGVVERIRDAVSRMTTVPDLKVSVSAGLATNECLPARLEEIIASGDAALYEAKKNGRDLVCVAQESYDVAETGIRRSLKQAGIGLTTGRYRSRRA